jgi:NAD(P)-dependent dehydrogenase (short-subunit alcohol dehydrogenase family)
VEAVGSPRTLDVHGRRVLVTGGGAGIGLAIARELARAGGRIHITDIREDAIADAMAKVPGITATCCDAGLAVDADRLRDDVAATLGGVDVVVGNVGIAGPTGVMGSYGDPEVERTIQVNLTSHFYVLDRLVPLLRQSVDNPSILLMGSVAGRLGYAMRSPYAATKWAIVGLVKSLAIELGQAGIRVNAILPGVVAGERMDAVISARAAAAGVSIDQMRADYLRKISLRRMVDAADVANLALFLASDMARNITGESISVDGHVEFL